MYRNFGNFSRGSEQSPGTGSPRPPAANSRTVDSGSNTTQPQQQKFPLGGAPPGFVPSLNTITSTQELQWLVQPSLWPQPPLPPYPPPPPLLHHPPPPPLLQHPAPATPGSTRRRPDQHCTPEELERRQIRRERNKMAAAKCRNRRRVLTDTLQNETERLEGDKADLQREIAGLEKEKEKLELVLEAHRPICKIHSDSDSDHSSEAPPTAVRGPIKTEPLDAPVAGPSRPKITLPPPSPLQPESLHTPPFPSTPSLTPFTSSLVFTYPPAPPRLSPPSQKPQACGVAHRRSSSSGDQSDHSLNSPTLIAL
ncbi:fos-related antigen 1-like [Conger conger]|uniref:fos-related antigen 1-like n=1 Tax=Conger conger TaxID=82655 RepID=UPI002A5ABCF6|nr:fos-related antigen 1-like [Conger conger]